MEITIELNGNPPNWIENCTHYFRNVHYEYWYAKVEKERVLITFNENSDWENLNITYKQASDFLNWQSEEEIYLKKEDTLQFNDTLQFLEKYYEVKENNKLFRFILDNDEKIWLDSVLNTFTTKYECTIQK